MVLNSKTSNNKNALDQEQVILNVLQAMEEQRIRRQVYMRGKWNHIARRRFLKRMGLGVIAASAFGASPLLAQSSSSIRRVLVMSDIHIGLTADNLDGSEWFSRALAELKKNVAPLSYALTLGDITQNGDRDSLNKYLGLREKSSIQRWFELAGNHEYYRNGISNYTDLVRSTKPYHVIDGNIAWFFISDEKNSRPGNITDSSYAWLKKTIALHRDKVLIVCSHQLPSNTIRSSDEDVFCLHPKEKVADILETYPIDLWLCGHEHHKPYSDASITRKNNTTFINVASMSHAYGSGMSESFILEFKTNAKKILARRRTHDSQSFSEKFDVEIPVRSEITFGK